jgi:hypothetical protein
MRRVTVVAVAACVALAGCGSGTGGGSGSNNQGNSFRFIGIFQETVEQFAPAADTFPSIDEAVGDTGRSILLATTAFVPTDQNGDGDLDGGFLGFRNELTQQTVNVQGVDVEIFIQGALVNPVVTDFVPVAVSLDHAPVGQDDMSVNVAFAQTIFVSPDVIAFLNANPNILPPKPFNMNVVMRATAISDSGDSFVSNEVTYNIVVE